MSTYFRKRSLWQCFEAKYGVEKIRCGKGHRLQSKGDGTISAVRAERGTPLVLVACQKCRDYSQMGKPIPEKQRGWVEIKR